MWGRGGDDRRVGKWRVGEKQRFRSSCQLISLSSQYSALQQRAGLMKQQLEARVRELESREVEQPSTEGDEDTAGEVGTHTHTHNRGML